MGAVEQTGDVEVLFVVELALFEAVRLADVEIVEKLLIVELADDVMVALPLKDGLPDTNEELEIVELGYTVGLPEIDDGTDVVELGYGVGLPETDTEL